MPCTMNRILVSVLLVFATVLSHAQGTMNIYQTNGSILLIDLQTIDSVTYQLAPPPPLMLIHQLGGSVLSLAVAEIDSITYSNGGNSGTPQIVTLPPVSLNSTTVQCGGYIASDGGSAVELRGVCWATTPFPTLADNTTSDGLGTGTYNSTLTGLTPGTVFYARAYAFNSQGVAYGNLVAFSTPVAGNQPTLTTTTVSNIGALGAQSGGTILTDGGETILARGVCWSTSPNPTTANSLFNSGSGVGTFNSNLSGLLPSTTYYVRAWATNIFGTGYGNELQFTTLDGIPSVSTASISTIGVFSAFSGGTVTSDGGAPIFDRGVAWSTDPNPTTLNNLTEDGSGLGSFTSDLTELQPGTTYFVRAYATNAVTTVYGNELQFTTLDGIPSVSTASISTIGVFSAFSGGTVTSDGGAPIFDRGVAWSTDPNPTTLNNLTEDGSGVGSFTSDLTELEPGTTYFVRAYVTNAVTTVYGNEVEFTTLDGIPILTTTPITITGISASSGGTFISDGEFPSNGIGGICWSTSPNPTTADNVTEDFFGGEGFPIEPGTTFNSSLEGLQNITTYYVRAYYTNAIATGYGNEVQFTTSSVFNPLLTYGSVTDQDGNTYATIVIGTQEWMAQNLRSTTYANGDPIPNVTDNGTWAGLTTGAWAHFNNSPQYEDPYGKLYNWYAVADPRNLCPTGWHVPALVEWMEAIASLNTLAGGKMKSVGTEYWNVPNTGATNESGFSGLPGGVRNGTGSYVNLGSNGYWWTSTEIDIDGANSRSLGAITGNNLQGGTPKLNGHSVRCIRD